MFQTFKLINLLINGDLIQTSLEHPFYVKGKWFVNAENLEIGYELLGAEQNILILEDIIVENFDVPITVYNFEVEDFHTYHVGNNNILGNSS